MALIRCFPSRALFPGGVLHCACSRCATWTWCAAHRRRQRLWRGGAAVERVRNPGQELAPVGTMARIESWDAPMPALLALRCVARPIPAASQLAKYGLWMGEAGPSPTTAEVPTDLRIAPTRWAGLIAGWRARACRPSTCRWRRRSGWTTAAGWPTAGASCCCAAGGRAGCWRCPTRWRAWPPCGRRAGRELKFSWMLWKSERGPAGLYRPDRRRVRRAGTQPAGRRLPRRAGAVGRPADRRATATRCAGNTIFRSRRVRTPASSPSRTCISG